MTIDQIKNHFGQDRTVYIFRGSLQELAELQEQTANSYGYVVVGETIYVVADSPITDTRAEALA